MTPEYYYFSNQFIHFFMKYSQLRNSEFQTGSEFLKLLSTYDEKNSVKDFNSFNAVYYKNGLYLFSNSEIDLYGFVLDTDNICNKTLFEENILQIIEKYFRIYIKLDESYPLSNSEIHISGTSSYIVNPFTYSNNEFIKYIINTTPEPKRDNSRNVKLFLNTVDGTGRLNYSNFSRTNYKKVKDNFTNVKAIINTNNKPLETIGTQTFYEYTEEKSIDLLSNYIGFSKYEKYLTETQKNVVYSDSLGPIKLTGPAGSGKTLSLILKALYLAQKYEQENKSLRLAFICHSEAMKEYIYEILSYDGSKYLETDNQISISVVTLLEWCCKYAIKDFSINDCLEVDSSDTKIMQEMLLNNAFKKFMEKDFSLFKEYLSIDFKKFLKDKNEAKIIDLLKNEISIYIKGPNIESLDQYYESSMNSKLIPLEKKEDYAAIYKIYEIYQQSLTDMGKYDIDDVSSVSLGFLTRAIWKRNRSINGYDSIFVDELHLYDFSEISILKYMLKEHDSNHIISASDVSQSSSDLDVITANINSISFTAEQENQYNVIFRSSQSIINLTKFLFINNISLFVNQNPLKNACVLQNEEGDTPKVKRSLNDNDLMTKLLNENFIKNHDKANTLIICTDFRQKEIFLAMLDKQKIPYLDIKRRNDLISIKKAKKECKLVVGYIDFVGGLEFDNVCILGFDLDKVPPFDNSMSSEFLKHIWYRKIYVAFTRARKQLYIYTNELKGKHPFIDSALEHNLIKNE